jgi:hypothetical protein
MKTRFMLCLPRTALGIVWLLAGSGCINDHVVFTTSTKFALDISQQADQPPKVMLGYKREEGVFLPSPHEPSTTTISESEKKEPRVESDSGSPPSNADPTPPTPASSKQTMQTDTYSVVSFICVMANPSLWDAIKGLAPFNNNVPDGLQVHSVFATGVAAQQASEAKEVREFYQRAAAQMPDRAEKRCF